jgi:NADPH-dependent curcumin reductase CurA
MSTSRQFRLAARPVGEAKATDWELVERPVPEPGDGEFVTEVTHISLDPAMRGWMNAGRSYVAPVEIGEVMRAFTLGRVVASRHEGFADGDLVHGLFGVQEHALSDGRGVHKIALSDRISLSAHLGVLGMTGMTAYFGLLDVGRAQEGETVLVSGAAGAVGTTVGQIAKIKGARAVGIAGGEKKRRMLSTTSGSTQLRGLSRTIWTIRHVVDVATVLPGLALLRALRLAGRDRFGHAVATHRTIRAG